MLTAGSRAFRIRFGLALASAVGVIFAIHCGSDGDSVFNDGPCASFPGECGKACVFGDDNGCRNGLHCAPDNKCIADCAPGSTCANGVQCSARGRCGEDPFDAGKGFGGDDAGPIDDDAAPTGDSCADIDVTLEKTIPTVLLLLDQSSSMTESFPPDSGVGRWDVLKSALLDPDGGVVKALQGDVSLGLSLYSYQNGGPNPDTKCPRLTNVTWQLNNYDPIFTTFNPAPVVNNTPTAESIMGVIGFDDAGVLYDGGFARATTPGPKILVLATDGDPDSCSNPDSNGSQPPRDFTVWAQRTYDAGIPTFVIGIGADITEAHQQAVANAGQGIKPDAGAVATIYRTTNKQQLINAFNEIIIGTRSCKFTLNGSVIPGTETKGRVTLNGAPLGLNDPNGWKLNGATEIEILGAACNTVKTSPSAQISVRFPCGTIENIPK